MRHRLPLHMLQQEFHGRVICEAPILTIEAKMRLVEMHRERWRFTIVLVQYEFGVAHVRFIELAPFPCGLRARGVHAGEGSLCQRRSWSISTLPERVCRPCHCCGRHGGKLRRRPHSGREAYCPSVRRWRAQCLVSLRRNVIRYAREPCIRTAQTGWSSPLAICFCCSEPARGVLLSVLEGGARQTPSRVAFDGVQIPKSEAWGGIELMQTRGEPSGRLGA